MEIVHKNKNGIKFHLTIIRHKRLESTDKNQIRKKTYTLIYVMLIYFTDS